MARRRHAVGDEEQGVDLTPMLDVVFILLIFFIVTATFVREKGLDVFNPDNNQEQQEPTPVVPIVIYVNARNEVRIPDARLGELRTISLSAVRANVERARVDNPKSPVIIQADPEADIRITVGVLDQARQAGAPGVTIAAVEN